MRTHRDRDPLTLRTARTLRETRRDPHDWWEPPQPIEPRRRCNTFRTRLAEWLRGIFNSQGRIA